MHLLQQQGQGSMPDRVAIRITHGAFSPMPSSTTPVDFHRICAILVWNLYFFCDKIYLTAISTFGMEMHAVANVSRTIAATKSFYQAHDLTHFTSTVDKCPAIFQFAHRIVQARNVCP